jgi:hypothetical protein
VHSRIQLKLGRHSRCSQVWISQWNGCRELRQDEPRAACDVSPPLDSTAFQSQSVPKVELPRHNLIEHDASISRNDFGPDGAGDDVHFNGTTFSTLANANPGKDYYDPVAARQVKRNHLAYLVATNPNVTNTAKEFTLRIQESALYLSILGDPLTGIASKKYVFNPISV